MVLFLVVCPERGGGFGCHGFTQISRYEINFEEELFYNLIKFFFYLRIFPILKKKIKIRS